MKNYLPVSGHIQKLIVSRLTAKNKEGEIFKHNSVTSPTERTQQNIDRIHIINFLFMQNDI